VTQAMCSKRAPAARSCYNRQARAWSDGQQTIFDN
jgi:hypothetical protein